MACYSLLRTGHALRKAGKISSSLRAQHAFLACNLLCTVPPGLAGNAELPETFEKTGHGLKDPTSRRPAPIFDSRAILLSSLHIGLQRACPSFQALHKTLDPASSEGSRASMMLRTPPSSRKRARLLEGSVSEDRAILPLPDDQEVQALAAYRHRSGLQDRELLAKLQLENAKLSQSLQTAEASSREFEV